MTPEFAREIIRACAEALHFGPENIVQGRNLLKRIIREGLWRTHRIAGTTIMTTHKDFAHFVTDALVTDLETIRAICREDAEALDLLDSVTTRGQGRPVAENGYNITVNGGVERGTDRAYALRRLRKQRQDLHVRVITGEVSPHAAMVEAGFLPKTFTVRAQPESAAKTLRKHFDPADLAELVRLLQDGQG